MAKRFTDTNKWDHAWFRKLSPAMKCAWVYLCDNCDHSGVWIEDLGLLSFQVGFEVSEADLLKEFADKLIRVDDDKYFIPSFIEFQYGTLRDNNVVHISVINALKRLGIQPEVASGYSDRPTAIMARLSFKRKKEIYADDVYTCGYCGSHGDDKTLVVDHIVPRSKGGDNEDENLITACVTCNSKKSDLPVNIFIERNSLDSTLSENLKRKIKLNKKLKAPFKDLNSPKDKEEDKDKIKELVKAKEQDKEIRAQIEIIYQMHYPLKKGKSDGIAAAAKQIKTEQDLLDFETAVTRYSIDCERKGTEAKYIKHFSTFVSTWRDWLDPDAGKATITPIRQSKAQQVENNLKALWDQVDAEEKAGS